MKKIECTLMFAGMLVVSLLSSNIALADDTITVTNSQLILAENKCEEDGLPFSDHSIMFVMELLAYVDHNQNKCNGGFMHEK